MLTDNAAAGLPHPADIALLGLNVDPADRSRASFVLEPHLARFDGKLYGGTALAVALAAMEAASERPALWSLVQFVASADMGERLDVTTELVARGGRIDQCQVHARVGDRLVFSALGATATARPDGMSGTGPTMPRVQPPESGTSHHSRFAEARGEMPESPFHAIGWHMVSDLLDVEFIDPPETKGRVAMWARIRGQVETTPAKLGFLADMVPLAIARACEAMGAGTSLDNALRLGRLVDTEWVLLDISGEAAHLGHGHGSVHVWAPDGTLMATGSQSAKLFGFDLANFDPAKFLRNT